MVRHGPEREKRDTPARRGWSLRHYMALFMAVLLAMAAVAALAVRSMAEQDARQSAEADANFATQKAAMQLNSGFDEIQAVSGPLANDPATAKVYADPTTCHFGYAPIGAFATGHIDLIRLDGSVLCSSRKLAGGGVSPSYAGQTWLSASAPVVVAPVVDPETGNQVVVVAYPVPGRGALVWFLDLAPIGPKLESEFGSGVHQLEFLITSRDGQTVVVRSIDPALWVGRNTNRNAFAGASDPARRPDLNGTQRIYGRSTINPAGWHLYVGADEAAALSAADQLANRSLAIVLVGAGIMLVVVFVVYRRIAEPVRRLSLVMRGSMPGNAVDAVAGTGATEVTALAEDFDKLMATVKRELVDRLRSEQAARVSEHNYRMLFEGHPQPMWLYDAKTLAFLEVNSAAVARYGYSRDEFLAMTITDIRQPQDVPKLLELVANPLPAFDRTGPWRHLLKDGSTAQVLVTSHALTFGDHDARFVLAEDITENQRLEIELHQSQARAESNAELSRAKDELVSTVSHELRTPLASIVGFAELMVTRDVGPEKRQEFLQVILQEGRRLTSLVSDFLDLRRIEDGHLTMRFGPADITALIERAVDLMSGAGAPVETRLLSDLPLVRVDSDSIFRVMANLLTNARKFSPAGGQIVIGAGVVEGFVEVYVQDQGLGIPAEALSQLFSKFYRVDNPDRRGIKGTGLGLAISKKIVEAHGGKIGVRSEGLGKGATFHFAVPVARERAQTGDVLVVEDDSDFAHLLEAELAARGLSSIWAADAETAERLMAGKPARAVVLDLLLPGLPGETFLQRLRVTRGPGMPVVVLTQKELDAAETLSLQKAGVTAVLRKGPGMAATAANLIAKSLAPELVAS
jgi:PAS domain S-box-containing protein